jgi:hypothetical protein
MKLKSWMILALLAFGCSAAFAQNVSLGFLSFDQKTQYCDFEALTVQKPAVSGVHTINTQAPCGLYNGVMAGLIVNIQAGSGVPVTGTVATLADSSVDAQFYGSGYCGCILYYVTQLQPSTRQQIKKGQAGWALYDNFGGGTALVNFGFTTKTLGNGGQNTNFSFPMQ